MWNPGIPDNGSVTWRWHKQRGAVRIVKDDMGKMWLQRGRKRGSTGRIFPFELVRGWWDGADEKGPVAPPEWASEERGMCVSCIHSHTGCIGMDDVSRDMCWWQDGRPNWAAEEGPLAPVQFEPESIGTTIVSCAAEGPVRGDDEPIDELRKYARELEGRGEASGEDHS